MRVFRLLLATLALAARGVGAAVEFDPTDLATAQFADVMEQMKTADYVAEAKKQMKYLVRGGDRLCARPRVTTDTSVII